MRNQLNPVQKRTLVLRDQYAKIGVNYDKATRRFLEQHGEEASTPTIKLLPVAVDLLRLQMVESG